MALIGWESAKYADLLILRDGTGVSVATVVPEDDDEAPRLKWKREKPDSTWPEDEDALEIAVLTKAEVFGLQEMPDGYVLIFNGKNRFWKVKSDPKETSDFQVVAVL